MSFNLKKFAVGTAAVLSVAGAVASTMSLSASADPKQYTAFVGVGSDTTQDVLNAFSGQVGAQSFLPVQSSLVTGQRQFISFDATPPAGGAQDCIITKTGAPNFNRPNGSSQGRRALSRAFDGSAGYGSAACGTLKDISGLVDFARSSSGPSTTDIGAGNQLTYIPFARDGVSFAYYKASAGDPVTSLTRAQLTSLFTGTGAQTIEGVRVLPCGIQTGSGTFGFWNSVTTASATQENTATTECNNLLGARAQENDGNDLKARGDAAETAVPGTQVVIGFSAGAFISKSNGIAAPTPPAGVNIGAISDDGAGNILGSPIAGTAPNLTPVAGFFSNTVFGRNVYNVLPTQTIASSFGNSDLKSIFRDTDSSPSVNTSTLCAETATIQLLGFLPASDCGSISLTAAYVSGTL
jgi:ABC-type phosphate transport system substrate-binding protein